MPELAEVEAYRRLAETATGRAVATVDTPDDWYLKGGVDRAALTAALGGRTFTAARRIGKLLLLDTDTPEAGRGPVSGPTLGLRFGMTGRLLVDDRLGVDRLAYSSDQYKPEWIRFSIGFADGGRMAVLDPRRLGGVFLDPDEDALGPDAASVGLAALRGALGTSRAPLKARLMDQAHLAGVGNLIADEVLWRAGLDPRRPAGSLTPAETRRLHRHLRGVVDDLLGRGGSHMGDLLEARLPGGRCPRDGAPLTRGQVGGRTTWWCPRHQR
ncbi:MAG: formamidopyrimidine-DNA glycosylase [Actinobacteria bacterium]|nr:MAG: formamidopyrimidine-DNA glycosylase [Actinomycetota bacterium]